ncbi:MAG: NAD(P)H-binding protein [Cyclobacteriaceae bacterium]
MEKTKIAIIGGTGKSGKYLVKALIDQGLRLKILVRNPDNFRSQNPLVEVVHGDVNDYDTIRILAENCRAVISTLGLGQPNSEPTIFSKSTKNVLRAMSEYPISHYIVTTGLNVDTPFDKKGQKTRMATDWMRANYPKSTSDKQSEYNLLVSSEVNWTLVRLPLIELTDDEKKILVSLEDCPGEKISAVSLANFLINQLSDQRFIGKAPFVADA